MNPMPALYSRVKRLTAALKGGRRAQAMTEVVLLFPVFMIRSSMNDVLDMGADRVIIDLRGNRGGSLAELSTALSYFSPGGGKLFTSMSRHKGYSMGFYSRLRGSYAGIPVVAVTDQETVSRAEIFISALREWNGCSVLGERTGGNVSATRGFTLKNGGIVRITVAKLFPPSGTDIDNVGVSPDIAVKTEAPAPGTVREFPPALASSDELINKALAARPL